jgi:hypothetical protein
MHWAKESFSVEGVALLAMEKAKGAAKKARVNEGKGGDAKKVRVKTRVKAKEDANKGPFSEAEDQEILTLQRTMDSSWTSIASQAGVSQPSQPNC